MFLNNLFILHFGSLEEMNNHKRLHESAKQIEKKEVVKNLLWIAVVLLVLYISIRLIGMDDLHQRVDAWGIYGPLLLIIAKASTMVFAPLGGFPLYIIAGTFFGFTKGLIYVLIGDALGATISFYISRLFGKKIAEFFVSKSGMKAVEDVLVHMGTTKGFFQARLAFIAFPEAASYAAGLTKINFWKFLVITLSVGLIPEAILVAFGDILTKNLNSLTVALLGVMSGLLTVLLFLWFYSHAKRKSSKSTSD